MVDVLSSKEIDNLLMALMSGGDDNSDTAHRKDCRVIEGLAKDAVGKIKTAFNKGYKQGYEAGVASQGFTDGYTEEEAGKREKDAYQKGMDEAWEVTRKIYSDDFDLEKVFDEIMYARVFKKFTASEALAKIKEYEQNQDEIKVGDEIIAINGISKPYVVTEVMENHVYGFDDTGVLRGLSHCDTKFKKTGRHFDQIEEVLKALKER